MHEMSLYDTQEAQLLLFFQIFFKKIQVLIMQL